MLKNISLDDKYKLENKFILVNGTQALVRATLIQKFRDEQENLKTALKSLSGADKINLSTAQDPTILGGLVLQSGSQIIDLSINGELRSISNYLGSNFEL